jgi:hypothetical protein
LWDSAQKRDKTVELSYNAFMASKSKNEDLIAAIRKVIGRLDRVIDEREAGVKPSLPASDKVTPRDTLRAMTRAALGELFVTRTTLLRLLSDLGDEAPDLRGS